jgi:ABC-type uncharacterized transport system auxiliary subunit
MRAAWLGLALLAAGCVFRDAGAPRFFRPESAALDGTVEAPPARDGIPLRLRSVTSAPLLRERIVWRSSSVEYGLYEQRRWSELPASFVERALGKALREEPGIQLSDAAGVSTLRVEVIAFDEVLAPAHVAAVSLTVSLEDHAKLRLFDRRFDVEEPIRGDGQSAMATAMGKALDAAVGEVAAAVGEALRGR